MLLSCAPAHPVTSQGELGEQIESGFEDGKDLMVTIVSAMGEEQAISFKVRGVLRQRWRAVGRRPWSGREQSRASAGRAGTKEHPCGLEMQDRCAVLWSCLLLASITDMALSRSTGGWPRQVNMPSLASDTSHAEEKTHV